MLTDFVFMVRDISQMFITELDVVHAVNGEVINQEELGGADVHSEVLGSLISPTTTRSCLTEVRYLLSLLPANNRELPPPPSDRPRGQAHRGSA